MVKDAKLNLSEIKTQCEATGASADNLNTCSDTASFGQCLFAKVRNTVIQQKLSMTGTGNTDTIDNDNNDDGSITRIIIET